eukprot:GHVR01030935.1.p2 GENE.GHVR01030935.1~~GHVR01030935.1.p2  ORF type:complete len:113 (-),score=16.34 GHVR01030935.1:310-648(-)
MLYYYILELNIEKLSDEQKRVDEFIRRRISSLNSASLAGGQQNNDDYVFRYAGKESPFKLTDVAVRKQQDNNYKLGKVVSSVTMPVSGGRFVKKVTAEEAKDLKDAKSRLGF